MRALYCSQRYIGTQQTMSYFCEYFLVDYCLCSLTLFNWKENTKLFRSISAFCTAKYCSKRFREEPIKRVRQFARLLDHVIWSPFTWFGIKWSRTSEKWRDLAVWNEKPVGSIQEGQLVQCTCTYLAETSGDLLRRNFLGLRRNLLYHTSMFIWLKQNRPDIGINNVANSVHLSDLIVNPTK